MLNTVYVDVSPERMTELFQILDNVDSDARTTVLAKPLLTQTHAPAASGKYKGLHRLKFEVLIPEDVVLGPNALLDMGAFFALKLPTERINPEFLTVEKD